MIYRLLLCLSAAVVTVWVVPGGMAQETLPGVAISNNNATRAAMYWRHMIGRRPYAAAQASMHWRVMSVEDPEGAAKAALEARKLTSSDPETMANSAMKFLQLATRNLSFARMADTYWKKMAAHDPEVTARSAMYWRSDPEAAMYW